MGLLRGLLPSRYSLLQESGNGIQSVYLTEVPPALAHVLIGLIGKEASILSERNVESVLQKPMQVENVDLELWEHHIESKIEWDTRIPDTERKALIVSRRGKVSSNRSWRSKLNAESPASRIRFICELATVSHGDSSNEERLNGENGLLLTPTIDHLFDRGFISFEDSGDLIVSPVARAQSLNRMGGTDRPGHQRRSIH
jgi:putative restriction endonuclease